MSTCLIKNDSDFSHERDRTGLIGEIGQHIPGQVQGILGTLCGNPGPLRPPPPVIAERGRGSARQSALDL